MRNNGIIRSLFFPATALAFAFRIVGANLGLGRAPHWTGWASILALLAAGATALTLLRIVPELGVVLGSFGVLAASYLVGAGVDAWLLAVFDGGRRDE